MIFCLFIINLIYYFLICQYNKMLLKFDISKFDIQTGILNSEI